MSNPLLDSTTLTQRLEAAGLPWRVSYHPTSRSTQFDALTLVQTHGPGYWLVVADRQEAGRGRAGHHWFTDPGDLAATWTVPLELPPDRYGKLSLLTGLIASEAVSRTMGIELKVKWPNDLYLAEQKCGGCLGDLTTTQQGVAACLGIGINLTAKAPERFDPPPLYPIGHLPASDPATTRLNLLLAISTLLHERSLWARPEHDAAFADWWSTRGLLDQRQVRVDSVGEAGFTGQVVGISPHGELLVRDAAGVEHRVTAGDVYPLDPLPAA